jgi:glycosyltransferase involved in cell wall biosynthesis
MPGVKLLKVGPAHFSMERQKLLSLITKMNLHKDVVFFDYVPDEDLPYFYNAAEVLVMPSLYEGFGLPVVEAMACGTPVVCTHAGSLPEVLGQAGVYVDPTDHRKMADALLTLLDNPIESIWMKQAGKQQAAKFTLAQTACAVREAYTKMLSQAIE